MGNNVKALAINKPVLQHHKGAAIFFEFFQIRRGYMTMTQKCCPSYDELESQQ